LTEGLVALRDWIGGGLVALDDDKGVLGELETAVLDDLRNGVVGGTLSEKVAALDGAKKGLLAAAVPVFESEVVAPLLAYCKGGGVQVVGGSLGKQGQDPSRQDAFRNASGFDAWDPANSGRLAEWFVEDGSIPKVGGTAKSSRGGVGVILGGGYGHRVCDAVRLGFGLRGLYSSAQARVLCPGSSKVSDGAYSLKCPLALSFGPELSFALCPGVVVHFLGGAQIGFCRLGSRNPGELYAAKARATLPIAGVSVNGRDLAGAEATKFYGKSGTTKKTGFGAYCEGGVNIAVYPGVWVGLCVGYGFGLKGPVTPGVASSRLSSLVISTTVRGYF
jgi:hypothetical protein